mmetsp:Transcript_105050/g.338739  ORF Transcript_105050/g.338739 Transcript_105050/m.338739 type:complete len:228 (-) Transcript_105050:455-1138(-)
MRGRSGAARWGPPLHRHVGAVQCGALPDGGGVQFHGSASRRRSQAVARRRPAVAVSWWQGRREGHWLARPASQWRLVAGQPIPGRQDVEKHRGPRCQVPARRLCPGGARRAVARCRRLPVPPPRRLFRIGCARPAGACGRCGRVPDAATGSLRRGRHPRLGSSRWRGRPGTVHGRAGLLPAPEARGRREEERGHAAGALAPREEGQVYCCSGGWHPECAASAHLGEV